MDFKVHAILFCLGINLVYSQNPCTNGVCSYLEDCPYLKSIQMMYSEKNLHTIQSRICGYRGTLNLFCCTYEELNSGRVETSTIPPTRPTTAFAPNIVTPDDTIVFPGEPLVPNPRPPANKKMNNIQLKCPNNLNPRRLLPLNCGPMFTGIVSRITGGQEAIIGEMPWMALLEYRTPLGYVKTTCGGALLNDRYILTAAHCVDRIGEAATWTLEGVRLGEHNTETDVDCQGAVDVACAYRHDTYSIEEQIVHEDYDRDSTDIHNDIALLRLSSPVKFSKFIKPICLTNDPNPSSNFVAAGWGQTAIGEVESEVLLKVDLPLYDHNECRRMYQNDRLPRRIIDSQLCVGGDLGKDTCTGDSGGPLMQIERTPDGEERWSVVGITSYGSLGCGLKNHPSVYTKVHSFMSWILCKLRP